MYLSREDFFQLRINRVREAASLYDLMADEGFEPRFRGRSGQMRCCFLGSHSEGEDRKPSARYYPAGERDDYETYYCWVCTERPLDAIGFMQRARSWGFMEALRFLERKYGVRYDDVEMAPDIGKVLKELDRRKSVVDPKYLFDSCERYLRENRDRIGMERFVKLSYALDMIYHRHDKKAPERSVPRLEKWKATARKLVGSDDA